MNVSRLLALGAALIVLNTGLATASSPTSLTITMKALNDSHEDGTAVLTQRKDGVHIVVTLANAPKDTPQPAHIHADNCNGDMVLPLNNLQNGKGESVVTKMTLAEMIKGKYVINVHASTSKIGSYVSCGTIAANSSSMSP